MHTCVDVDTLTYSDYVITLYLRVEWYFTVSEIQMF